MIDPQTSQVLAAYEVGQILELVPAGGTAGRTWKVTIPQAEEPLRWFDDHWAELGGQFG